MIEYADFQCPFCGKFAQEVRPTLLRDYVDTGKMLLAFRHLPLSKHRLAEGAAEAAECAGRQDRFWEMHARLFASPDRLDRPSLREHAQYVGLRLGAFDRCMNGEVTDKVRADAAAARELSVTGTPSFFLGAIEADGRVRVTRRLHGARPVQDFRQALDGLLATEPQ